MYKREKWHQYNSFSDKNEIISFTNSGPSIDVINKYFKFIEEEIEGVMEEYGSELFNYADIKGDVMLKKRLILNGLAGEKTSEKMVLITNGGQEAIKTIVETVLKSGDRIMVDRLSYIGLEQVAMSRGISVVGFSDNLNNLELSKIENEITKNKPRMVYLVPDFSNPGGENLRKDVRRLICNLAKKLSFLIIEDQTYRELYYEKKDCLESMYAMSDKVIIVGSVSKIIVPGLRIGWIVTKNGLLMARFVRLKESISLSTNNINQKIVSVLLEDKYRKTIPWVRNYYRKKMEKTLECMESEMPSGFVWNKPKGGFYIWVEGPKIFNANEFLKVALKNRVGFIPGEVFYYKHQKMNTFRLSISSVKLKDIKEGIHRLSVLLKGEKIIVKDDWRNKFNKLFCH